ncbi:MAG: AraC family transcriptional regulator [Bacillota bacterium]|nr:AraC family transcriptional regulator [Bacillota bacterium]
MASQQYTAEQLSSSLSSEFNDLVPIVSQIVKNNHIFWPSLWENDNYNRTALIWELNKYKQYSVLLQDCILIYRNHDAVFTSSTQDTIDDFFSLFQVDSITETKIMSTTKTWDIISSNIYDSRRNIEYQALLYVIPFSIENVLSNDMVIVFVIPREFLDKWSQRFLGSQPYYLHLFDESEIPVMSFGSYISDSAIQIEEFNNCTYKQQLLYMDKQAVTLFKFSVGINKLDMILETPMDNIIQQLVAFRKLFIMNGILIMILGMVLVILFSYYNYVPLKKIMQSMKFLSPAIVSADNSNEFKQIDTAISAAITKSKNLESYINQQGKIYFSETLSLLLAGSIFYKKIDKYFDITTWLPGPHFCVLAIHLQACEPDIHQNQLITSALASSLDRLCKHAIVEVPSYRCTAIIFCLEENDYSCMHERAGDIYSKISARYPLYMGVSSLHAQIGELSQCMIEAYLSLDYTEKKKELAIQYYQNSFGNKLHLNLMPDTVVNAFTQSLKNGNRLQCINIFNNMMNTIDSGQNQIFTQIQYYDIANTVLRIIGDLDLEDITLDINFLELYQDLEKFRNKMNLILTDVCKRVAMHYEHSNVDPFSDILAYVNEHYLEYDMSLDKLATDFDMSISMISKMFKASVGTGFKEYLIKKRLNTAKHLLCSTDMPIHNITTAVGYTNNSHFIKMFKISDGMTPAEYRKQYGYVK